MARKIAGKTARTAKAQAQPRDDKEILKELYLEQLRDLYSAEAQALKVLPRMAKAAKSDKLRKAFETHLKQTTRQRDDVEKLITKMGGKAKGHTCKGMQGILAEGLETIDTHKKSPPMIADAALIGAAQRSEHYEISGYGTARSIAELVGDKNGVKVLDRIAQEEGDTDKLLTSIAREAVMPSLGGQAVG
jgi:ferritin-like metal-binding protein YciE